MTTPLLRFTAAESQAAHKAWKATCGPHAIAAATGRTLDEVRAALENYKGWMNPTQIGKALMKLSAPLVVSSGLKTQSLCNGINRIQWEGPWLDPGKPPALAYRHTHYVAHFDGQVLCTACISHEWISTEDWKRHLQSEPAFPFHITHHWSLPIPP